MHWMQSWGLVQPKPRRWSRHSTYFYTVKTHFQTSKLGPHLRTPNPGFNPGFCVLRFGLWIAPNCIA
jgi:hypothetical protein